MQLDVKTGGFEDLDKLLKQLPERVAGRVLQQATTNALRSVRSDVKAAAPVGVDKSPASQKYGPTRKNIRVIRLRRTAPNEKAARIDTGNAFWNLFYELGTRRQSARPWFGPAIRRLQERIFKKLGTDIGAGIEREATRK